MSGQHTPGPWSLRETPWAEGKKHYIQGPTGRALATTLSMESSDARKKAEVAANAHIIAAAPELLTACADWIAWLDSDGWVENAADHETQMLDAMRAAIAKARGEQS